jgi:predicted amidophosphoribosyltransferase
MFGLAAQASRESACGGCGRTLAVKDGYCRLCWQQARYQSKLAGGLPRGAVSVLADQRPVAW